MNPATSALLRAVAALASHAQASPTDSAGIARLRVAQGKAAKQWTDAGSPDLTDAPKPAVISHECGKVDESKDWTMVSLDVEVKRATEKAMLLSDGDGEFWCPRSVLAGDVDNEGDIGTVSVPRWVREQ